MIKTIFLGLALSTLSYAAKAETTETEPIQYYEDISFKFTDGKYVPIDGDTFWFGIHPIRIYGIDTIEVRQVCFDGEVIVDCHRLTMNFLESDILKPDTVCRPHLGRGGVPHMSHSRYVASCYSDGKDIGRMMVEAGWAVAAKGSSASLLLTLTIRSTARTMERRGERRGEEVL